MDAAKQIPSSSVHERSFKGERSTRHELLRVSYFVSPERLNVMRRNRRQKEVSRVEGCDAKTSRGQTTTNPKASSESTFNFEPRATNPQPLEPDAPFTQMLLRRWNVLGRCGQKLPSILVRHSSRGPFTPTKAPHINEVSLSNWGSL